MRRLIALGIALFPSIALAVTIDLSAIAPNSPVTGSLEIRSVSPITGRCHIDFELTAPRIWADLDQVGKSRGNLGSRTDRFYWVGETRFRHVSADGVLFLTSRARYEKWVVSRLLKTRLLRDTKAIDLTLHPDWNGATQTLTLTYQIENIRNFPGEIEQILRRYGVTLGGSTRLQLPADGPVAGLEPQLESGPKFAATPDALGLRIGAEISLKLPSVTFLGYRIDSCDQLQSVIDSENQKAIDLVVQMIKSMKK